MTECCGIPIKGSYKKNFVPKFHECTLQNIEGIAYISIMRIYSISRMPVVRAVVSITGEVGNKSGEVVSIMGGWQKKW